MVYSLGGITAAIVGAKILPVRSDNLDHDHHDPFPALRLQNPQRGTPKPGATHPPAYAVGRTGWVHPPLRRVAGTADDRALLWIIHDNLVASCGHRGSTWRESPI